MSGRYSGRPVSSHSCFWSAYSQCIHPKVSCISHNKARGKTPLTKLAPCSITCRVFKDWKNFIGAFVLKIIYLVICTWDEAGPHTDLQKKSSKNINTYFLTKTRFTKYTYCTCLTCFMFFFFFHVHSIKDENPSPASMKSDLLKNLADGLIPHAQTTGTPSDSSSLPPHPEQFFSFLVSFQTLFPPKNEEQL